MYTPQSYRRLLTLLKAREYRFVGYGEKPFLEESAKVVYLRHDIDYSPEWALDFARINADHGIFGTFFFQTRSPIYNLLAYRSLAIVEKIVSLGQHVGLHYTIHEKNTGDKETLVKHIAEEYRHVLAYLPKMSPVFSWHNPSLAPDILISGMDMEISGMINTYSRYFIEEVRYFADSNLRYSLQDFDNIIDIGHPRLQLLFHPFQWMTEGKSMKHILAKTWIQVIRERETEFLNNHIYRELFPVGMPSEWLEQLSIRFGEFSKPGQGNP